MSSMLRRLALGATAMLLIASLLAVPAYGEGGLEVVELTYSPDPPVLNMNISISFKLAGETDVTNVMVFWCDPISCYLPSVMELGEGGVWSGMIGPVISDLEHHFNITVYYGDGSTNWTDDMYFTPVTSLPTDLEVELLEHVPEEVPVGVEADVYCKLIDAMGVETIYLYHCQGEACFTPIEMELLANGSYTARIGPFDTADEVKYNVTVTYASGGSAWTADGKFTPEITSNGNGGDGDDDGFIPAVGVVTVLAVLAALAVTRRRKMV